MGILLFHLCELTSLVLQSQVNYFPKRNEMCNITLISRQLLVIFQKFISVQGKSKFVFLWSRFIFTILYTSHYTTSSSEHTPDTEPTPISELTGEDVWPLTLAQSSKSVSLTDQMLNVFWIGQSFWPIWILIRDSRVDWWNSCHELLRAIFLLESVISELLQNIQWMKQEWYGLLVLAINAYVSWSSLAVYIGQAYPHVRWLPLNLCSLCIKEMFPWPTTW